MENWFFYYQYAQSRQKELLKEAEIERMIKQLQTKNKTSPSYLQHILNHLGGLMIKMGIFLQKKYQETSSGAKCSEHKLLNIKN
ncbi:MAG: hypothetical protein Kow00103_12080 [Candidatus Caldatribacteriota bacterium]